MEILNSVQRYIINDCNTRGVNLHDEFATVEDFKKFVIGLTFKTIVSLGHSVEFAYNAIFGNGAYNDMAEKVWQQANA